MIWGHSEGSGDDEVLPLVVEDREEDMLIVVMSERRDLGTKSFTSDMRISGQRRDAYVIRSVRAFHSRSLAF